MLQGKAVVRPIAFRPLSVSCGPSPCPVNGAPGPSLPPGIKPPETTPTGPFREVVGVRVAPSPAQSSQNTTSITINGGSASARVANPQQQQQAQQPQHGKGGGAAAEGGFAPGHPLVKEGRKHYGSEYKGKKALIQDYALIAGRLKT